MNLSAYCFDRAVGCENGDLFIQSEFWFYWGMFFHDLDFRGLGFALRVQWRIIKNKIMDSFQDFPCQQSDGRVLEADKNEAPKAGLRNCGELLEDKNQETAKKQNLQRGVKPPHNKREDRNGD